MLQKVQIKQNEKEPWKVEVLVDGVNIANRISGYTLTQEPTCFPVLTVRSNSLLFEYEGLAEVIDISAHEEIARLKRENEMLLCLTGQDRVKKFEERALKVLYEAREKQRRVNHHE